MESSSLVSNEPSAKSQPQQRSSSPDGHDDEDPSQKRAPVRKRTKTGCLSMSLFHTDDWYKDSVLKMF